MRRILTTGLILGSLLTPTLSAWAQMESREAIELQNQILEMRRDLQQVQQQSPSHSDDPQAPVPTMPSAGGGSAQGGGNDLVPQLLERVQTLEDQVRTLRGKVDQLENQSTRSQADLAKQLSDMQFQMQQGGQSGQSGAGGGALQQAAPSNGDITPFITQSPQPQLLTPHSSNTKAPSPTPQAAVAPPRKSPEALVRDANNALQHRDFRGAEAAARALQQSGKHAYDAQFIIAQAKAGQKNYKDAAIAYDDTYNHNRHGTWAQDGLLGVAVSLYNLGDSKASCAALRRLNNEFPSQRPDVKQNAAALRGRASC